VAYGHRGNVGEAVYEPRTRVLWAVKSQQASCGEVCSELPEMAQQAEYAHLTVHRL